MTFFKTPQAFYDAVIGKGIDVDNFPIPKINQCWDLKAYFCHKEQLKVDLYCSLTGYAGDLYKLRYEKGFDKYFDFFYPRHAKKGDWIYWNQHVAMVWDVDLQADRVLCLGQNQSGHPYVDLKWYKLSTALGCMRYYPWIEDRTHMYGIDISNWQNQMNLSSVLEKTKTAFVIAKATEGLDFVDPYFEGFLKTAESKGKLIGLYHFARPEKNGAYDEAKFFYKTVKKYIGKAVFILDWESSGKANVTWAKQWLDMVKSLSGITPMIYMSESVTKAYEWAQVANAGYPLWVAKYKDNSIDKNYDMTNAGAKPVIKYWTTYVMWQWTSSGRLDGYTGNLDCNIFYGNEYDWNRIARGSGMDGWKKSNGNWYYYKNGKMLTGWQELKWSKGQDWFYFNSHGIMLTGWQKLKWSGGSNWFYFEKENGTMLQGVVRYLEWNGKYDWYGFDKESGAMVTNYKICTLEFDSSGKLIGGVL